jgi:hypothetical protein
MTAKTDRDKLWYAAATVLVVLLMIIFLRAQGRLFLCACGYFEIWTSDTCSSNNSQHLFDPYSFTHLLHGFLFFWLATLLFKRFTPRWQIWIALLLESAWEVFENSRFVIDRYRTATAALGYQGDTIVNSIGDLMWAIGGFMLARYLGVWRSIFVFLLVELILLFWIHDSLILQILMLVWPVDAIKSWQMCS